MNRLMKRILCFLAAAVLVGITAGAEEETMHMDWQGDYENFEIVISLQSPVEYVQEITAVMFPANLENPEFTDYCRIGAVSVQGKEEAEIRFKISDRLTAEDGAYIIRVQGSGYRMDQSYAEEKVWVLRPSDVSDADGNGLLKQINEASADSVKPYVERISKALQLTVAEDESMTRWNAFIRVRNDSYQGNFKKINEVAEAWRLSGVIAYLSQEQPSAAVLETKIGEIAELISVDMTDAMYQAYREDIYKNMILISKQYHGGAGVQNPEDIKTVFSQAKALSVTNGSSVDELENRIQGLYGALGISDDVYSKYAGYERSERQKVLRQIYHKDFLSIDAVCSAFTNAVNQVSEREESGTTPSLPGGSGGSGGSSGGGSGRGLESGFAISEEPGKTEKPSAAFSDCGTEHWAYPYVMEMKNSGMISGYADGNFYPENKVLREEFVKMAVLAAGLYEKDAVCNFEDVLQGEWYYPYVASAKYAGMVSGVDEEHFGIGQEMKREDVAVMVYRILTMLHAAEAEDGSASATEKDFADSADISGYAKESVEALTNMKLLGGFEDGSFRPQACLTRAEAAKIICMFKGCIQK